MTYELNSSSHKIILRFLLILAVSCNITFASDADKITMFTFNKHVKNRSVPFHVFPKLPSLTIFRHAHWGINIESVKVDGKIIEPYRDGPWYLDDTDFRTATIKSDGFSYMVSENFFLFCEGEVSMKYKMCRYCLPDKFDIIDIQYRIRYADNTLSPPYRVIGMEHDSPQKGKSELGGMIRREK